MSFILIIGVFFTIVGFSSPYLWYTLPLYKSTDIFNIYAEGNPPYDFVFVASLFDRGLSYRAYAYKLKDEGKVAIVEFKQPVKLKNDIAYYVEELKVLGSTDTIYVGQAFAGEIVSKLPHSIVVSPTTLTRSSTVVVGTADFDGSKKIASYLEKMGAYVVWTKATHTTIAYNDGICEAIRMENCSDLIGLFFRMVMAIVGMFLMLWWVYAMFGCKLKPNQEISQVNIWLLLLFPLVGFVLPFVFQFFHLPILGVEELLPLSGFAALVGLLSGGKYRFINLGVGLIIATVMYILLMLPLYYLGIFPYITLNKLAVVPVVALLISPYTVALERCRYHASKIPFSSLWIPFVYLLLWLPFLFEAFFYNRLPFYHIFFYSYKFLWIHIIIGFITLPFFKKQPEYTGLTTSYLWAMYMVFLLVEIA